MYNFYNVQFFKNKPFYAHFLVTFQLTTKCKLALRATIEAYKQNTWRLHTQRKWRNDEGSDCTNAP